MDLEPNTDSTASFDRLAQIVSILRGEKGCPWDIKQTPISLQKYLREECQELIEAIDKSDEKEVCEEIGDVLFILAMLITMYAERELFSAGDVFAGIVAKMIRRHPHVFGDVQLTDAAALRAQWQHIKEQEKNPSLSTHDKLFS
jgi:nucleoside triphosphate diphosphatase